MALRTKTVEFATTTDIATLAVTTNRDKTVQVYLPESSITFKSVLMECVLRDDTTTDASLTSPTLGIQLAAVAIDSAAVTNPPAATGESETYCFWRDVTSYFTTNWTGTNMTATMRINCTGMISNNHSFRLVITYQYDDTSATQIKTVRIPIESTRQYATNAWATLGGATAIPALTGGYLPENTPTIRQAFLDLWGNESPATATTDVTLSIRVNGGTQRDIWRAEQGYTGNGCNVRARYDLTSETTYGSARSLEMICGTTSRYSRMGGLLVVTYEFTLSGTTTVMNSILLGGIDTIGSIPGTTSGDVESWRRTILIEEPASITLKESAVCLFMQSAAPAGSTINVACGDQSSYTAYTMSQSNSFEIGCHSLVHRIDASGQNGTAFETFGRGLNVYELRIYSGTNDLWWNLNGFCVLNYTSDVATAGPGTHAQTRFKFIAPHAAAATARQIDTKAAMDLGTDETDHYLMGVVSEMNVINGTTGVNEAIALLTERAAGEGPGGGWENLYAGMALTDNEGKFYNRMYGAPRTSFKRWPLDTDADRLSPTATRSWRIINTPAMYTVLGIWTTIHQHKWTIAGTVSNYADADGAGLTVEVHRSDTDEKIGTLTTGTGGTFTMTWYDNTIECYAQIYEDGTHVGRSVNAVAA